MKGKRMNRYSNRGTLAGLTLLAALAAAPAMAGDTLIVNGKPASADVKTIGGSAYVKLADIAAALGMVVVKRADGKYEITRAGGANQIQGSAQGKIGEVLFDGKWRFQVLSVQTPESYTMTTMGEPYDATGLTTFDRPNRVVKPSPNNTLVVLQCRATNGVNEKRTLWTAISDTKIHTAIADMDGTSHTPVAYDFEGGPIQSKWLVPGAALNFAVLFSVPKDTRLKDLIFTLKNNQGDDKGNDVRVSLAQEKSP
jgi:hypothetical protein